MGSNAIESKEDALSLLRALLYGAQKARSVTAETWGDSLDEAFMANVNPWLYGKGNIVPKLAEAISQYEKPGAIVRGSELFNFVYVATKAEPSIIICSGLFESHRWRAIETDVAWMSQVWS